MSARAALRISICTAVLWLVVTPALAQAGSVPPLAGASIYLDGVTEPGDAPVQAERAAGAAITGAAAACVNCHRRSGLGTVEGTTVIPPIIGKYLFQSQQVNAHDLELPHLEGYQSVRVAYTDTTLARAIREGVAPDGRPLSYLMPRYHLDDAAMETLISYLRQLTSAPVPGVSDEQLQFATIITPDSDASARTGMLEVLQKFFETQNRVIADEVRPMKTSRAIMYRVTRKWQLHVWELRGAPETWEQQLNERLATEPVFAVISGIGGRTWAPVHAFCEHQGVPCLFPNTDVPVVAENDFYPVYFNRGVLLEADLLAHAVLASQRTSGGGKLSRVLQVARADDSGAAGSAALKKNLLAAGSPSTVELLTTPAAAALRSALTLAHAGDTLVLWLRPADLRLLPAKPPTGVLVYVSGLMAGLENAPLPLAWRSVAHLSYPYDLPALRRVRMNFPLGWMRIQNISVVDERVQADTYLSCVILSETLGHMLDSFVREFLNERLEMMLSRRLINAYYPRLGLAPGQRFASKGGYLVHFVDPTGTAVAADGDWTVP